MAAADDDIDDDFDEDDDGIQTVVTVEVNGLSLFTHHGVTAAAIARAT